MFPQDFTGLGLPKQRSVLPWYCRTLRLLFPLAWRVHVRIRSRRCLPRPFAGVISLCGIADNTVVHGLAEYTRSIFRQANRFTYHRLESAPHCFSVFYIDSRHGTLRVGDKYFAFCGYWDPAAGEKCMRVKPPVHFHNSLPSALFNA